MVINNTNLNINQLTWKIYSHFFFWISCFHPFYKKKLVVKVYPRFVYFFFLWFVNKSVKNLNNWIFRSQKNLLFTFSLYIRLWWCAAQKIKFFYPCCILNRLKFISRCGSLTWLVYGPELIPTFFFKSFCWGGECTCYLCLKSYTTWQFYSKIRKVNPFSIYFFFIISSRILSKYKSQWEWKKKYLNLHINVTYRRWFIYQIGFRA